jgi:V-type H+-transporting ATPase subunit C
MPNYWLVSLPLGRGGRGQTWELLQEKTSYGQQLSSNAKLEVPELRVGTLDTLLQHSDDLSKTSLGTEAIVGKLRRTIHDVGGPQAVSALKVENLPVESYLTRFRWVQRCDSLFSGTSRCCAVAAAGHDHIAQQKCAGTLLDCREAGKAR